MHINDCTCIDISFNLFSKQNQSKQQQLNSIYVQSFKISKPFLSKLENADIHIPSRTFSTCNCNLLLYSNIYIVPLLETRQLVVVGVVHANKKKTSMSNLLTNVDITNVTLHCGI